MRGQERRARQRGVLQQELQNQGHILPFTHQDGGYARSLCVKGNHCTLLGPLSRDQSWEKPLLTCVPMCGRWPLNGANVHMQAR